MLIFGIASFGVYTPLEREYSSERTLPFRHFLAAGAIGGLALSVAGVISLAATMTGASVFEVESVSIWLVILETAAGTAWQVRLAALGLVCVIAFSGGRWPKLWFGSQSVISGIALATLAWTGHGAMDDGASGILHLAADVVHLLAVGTWFGALVALASILFRPSQKMTSAHLHLAYRSLARFATIGTVAVGLIVTTGLINMWFVVGPNNLGSLSVTPYGRLLLIKFAIFSAMLALAAINRFRLTPALNAMSRNRSSNPIASLRCSLLAETGCALGILALIAWLGTVAPPISGP